MLEDYCNQTAVLLPNLGPNKYNEISFGQERIIKVRKEEKVKLVRDKKGTQVVSNTTVLSTELIKVDDKIDGRIVIAVGSYTGLDGETIGYEAYLS